MYQVNLHAENLMQRKRPGAADVRRETGKKPRLLPPLHFNAASRYKTTGAKQ